MNNLKFLVAFTVVSLTLTLSFGFFYLSQKQEADREADVPVVLKGETEPGYGATVMLYIVDSHGSGRLCGGTIISDGVAVTAAHCVDAVTSVYINSGDYDPNNLNLVKVEEIYVNKGWEPMSANVVKISNLKFDFAVLTFDPKKLDIKDSKPTSPSTTCGYKVVAYGLRFGEENIDISLGRKKESIDVCITDKTNELIVLSPEKGTGICFGDSGSPVYRKDTNEVVGLISSVFTTNFTEKTPCHIDNVAIAVRIDAFESVLARFYGALPDSDLAYDFNNDFDSQYDDSLGNSFDSIENQNTQENNEYEKYLDSQFDWDKFKERYGLNDDDEVNYFKDEDFEKVPLDNTKKANYEATVATTLLIVFVCFCCFTIFMVVLIVTIVVTSRRKSAPKNVITG